MKQFTIFLLMMLCMLQGITQTPCVQTPFLATAGNHTIPITTVGQEFCFLDQCQPIAGVNFMNFDAAGPNKKMRVVAPNSHVSAVFINYGCDTVLSVQCDGIIADTAVFELDYFPRCLVAILADVPDTVFVLPGPGNPVTPPTPYDCIVLGVDVPIAGDTPPLYTHYFTRASTRDYPAEPGVYIVSWPEDPYRKPEKIVILH